MPRKLSMRTASASIQGQCGQGCVLYRRKLRYHALSRKQSLQPAAAASADNNPRCQEAQQQQQQRQHWHHNLNRWACSFLAACALGASPAEGATPYQLANSIQYGVNENGSLRACPSNINPNCVGTASFNYALQAAIEELYGSSSHLISAKTIDGVGEYLSFGFDSMFGEDIAEFLIKPEGADGALVTYRSIAGSVKYIWPIQQPISDFDSQRKRLVSIREKVGWPIIGCELLECYME